MDAWAGGWVSRVAAGWLEMLPASGLCELGLHGFKGRASHFCSRRYRSAVKGAPKQGRLKFRIGSCKTRLDASPVHLCLSE